VNEIARGFNEKGIKYHFMALNGDLDRTRKVFSPIFQNFKEIDIHTSEQFENEVAAIITGKL
jgi:hypothetical protein